MLGAPFGKEKEPKKDKGPGTQPTLWSLREKLTSSSAHNQGKTKTTCPSLVLKDLSLWVIESFFWVFFFFNIFSIEDNHILGERTSLFVSGLCFDSKVMNFS